MSEEKKAKEISKSFGGKVKVLLRRSDGQEREDKISRISKFLGEDPKVVGAAIDAEALEKASTLEELSLVNEKLRYGTTLRLDDFVKIFRAHHNTLSKKEIDGAVTKEEIKKAFSRTLDNSESKNIAICKMAALFDNKEKEKEEVTKDRP